MVEVDENSNGSQIEVATGETLEIRLSENRTTGYKWSLETRGDACVLADDVFEAGKAPGQPGVHRWRFRAERAGTSTIELSYCRSWKPQEPPARTFKLNIQVS